MKRFAAISSLILAFAFVSGAGQALAQATFNVSFEFEAGGRKYPKGEYTVIRNDDGQILLKQESAGKETQIPVLNKLDQPDPPLAEPQLVFDAVGNFEPSYTEYFTVYILSEVWFPGRDGFEVHVTKGAHQTKIVKGEAKK